MKGPMPLEDLPEYLKSLQRNGSLGDGMVVDMGTIVSPRKSWLKAASYLSVAILFVGISGLMTYNKLSTQNVTVVLHANNSDPDTVSKIVTDGGDHVVSVEQKSDSTYEVKLSTRKSLASLIDLLLKNKDVRKVELED